MHAVTRNVVTSFQWYVSQSQELQMLGGQALTGVQVRKPSDRAKAHFCRKLADPESRPQNITIIIIIIIIIINSIIIMGTPKVSPAGFN